ncbi:EAL domain-containing protein [uncultured Roseobacter sp.]|uniref:putative bifunctional diguanylate cyclase/phosphodiesterase n=1 Tax=uncultured Roseobacter sp. TaxID=114847 RepID=UPI0026052F33|nr:EAL domain-containing protein [uncultured Roseobacter sp.]
MGLALLVLFVMGGHGLHIITGKQGALDEEVLNVSGRQRMLSQRILLLAHKYNDDSDARYEALLSESVEIFTSSHDWITSNAVVPGTAVHSHYFSTTGANLDQRSLEFTKLANELRSFEPGSALALSAAAKLEEIALVNLLSELNTAVALFEAAANKRASTLEHIQIAVVAATLVIIALEVLLIFYPAHRTMTGMINRLRHQAWHDQLTGLINRAEFVERTKSLIDRYPDELENIIVLGLDLDGFKQINDTMGHPAGDLVLQSVASTLRDELNEMGGISEVHVSRVGGDEFLVSLHTDSTRPGAFALRIGQQLIDAVEQPIAVTTDERKSQDCSVGVSIGFALLSQTNGEIEAALGNADIALYKSKQGGKGIVTLFEPEMRRQIEREHRIKHELRTAIRGLEFRAFFQPQIDLNTGRVAGVEALARWKHPGKGIVGPADFIEMAEEVKLIDALDGQIILNAFQEFKRCRSNGIDLGTLSVNASGMALRDPEFCEVLSKVAAAHDIGSQQVTVEVLENILLKEDDPSLETIRKLSQAGFGVAIDDFGVGFSSLARVGYLNVSAIKIDRLLTSEAESSNMSKVLHATAAMAKGLNARLFAEGIETASHMQIMRSIGVEIGQGFFWAHPMSADDLCEWIKEEHRYCLKVV